MSAHNIDLHHVTGIEVAAPTKYKNDSNGRPWYAQRIEFRDDEGGVFTVTVFPAGTPKLQRAILNALSGKKAGR